MQLVYERPDTMARMADRRWIGAFALSVMKHGPAFVKHWATRMNDLYYLSPFIFSLSIPINIGTL